LNTTIDGYYIRNVPGFSTSRKTELTNEEISELEKNPWIYSLYPSWNSVEYILNSQAFKPSQGIFLRPCPNNVDADIYFVLPYKKSCKFLMFQFKSYGENNDGCGKISWASIQNEVKKVCLIFPDGNENNTIEDAFSNDDIHICLVLVVFGLSKEVCLALRKHYNNTGEKSMLLSSGDWILDKRDYSLIKKSQNLTETPVLSIPNNLEILFLSKEGLKCLLGSSNYELLEQYNTNFKLNLLAQNAHNLFNIFGCMTFESKELGMISLFYK